MLRGDKVGLRARHEDDVPILQSELYDDIATRSQADTRPWRPIAPGSPASPYAVSNPADDVACFSVVSLADDELIGEAILWEIDLHNRAAHIGISLRPALRGRGLAVDVVRVLCHYGFMIRGMHRLQVETVAGNAAMIRVATQAGFVPEGTLRRAAWANGDLVGTRHVGVASIARSRTPRIRAARSTGVLLGRWRSLSSLITAWGSAMVDKRPDLVTPQPHGAPQPDLL
jgi:RimJ/RimL family protein N-acetyltransferase